MNGIVLRVGDRVRPSSAAYGKRAGPDGSVPGSQDVCGAVGRGTVEERDPLYRCY
jgi:hypothetical protein